MTRVYRLGAGQAGFCGLAMAHDDDVRVLQRFEGASLRSVWRAYPVEPIVEDLALGVVLGDYARLGTVPVFSQRAVKELTPMLEPNGELLPLEIRSGTYYAFNVTRVVDVLDEGSSDIERFASGKVMMINQHVFRKERLMNLAIFKIPQLLRSNVYVTEILVRRVHQAGLTGFDFEKVWSGVELGDQRRANQ